MYIFKFIYMKAYHTHCFEPYLFFVFVFFPLNNLSLCYTGI